MKAVNTFKKYSKVSESNIKKQYIRLVKKYHPDTTLSKKAEYTEIIKEINNAYDIIKKHGFQWSKKKTSSKNDNPFTDEDLNNIFKTLNPLDLTEDLRKAVLEVFQFCPNKEKWNHFIKIELAGSWLWLELNHAVLNAEFSKARKRGKVSNDFGNITKCWKWSPSKEKFYYYTGIEKAKYRKKSKKSMSFEDIKNTYGSYNVREDEKKSINVNKKIK